MRLKIIAGNLIAVLVIGLVAYVFVKSELEADLASRVDSRIANDSTLFDRSWRLSGLSFVDQVGDRASNQPVTDAFLGLDESSRRTRAHEACNTVAQWFRDPARARGGAPEIVAITDETGRVVARNQDPNRMHGQQLVQQLPGLRAVLRGGGAHQEIWNKEDENKLLQTGIAPIHSEAGAVIGALVVGYDLSNGLATREGEILGRDVAFLRGDNVYSSSLEDTEPLKQHLFGEGQRAQTEAALSGTVSQPWQANLAGADWVGVTSPLAMSGSVQVAYVVLANKSEYVEIADTANVILILTALGALMVLIYGFLIGTLFLKPVEAIEEGVLAVINGRTDLRLDIESAEFGGLAYRINQLINVFTGVSEEDDQGRVSGMPGAPTGGSWDGFSDGGAVPQGGGAASEGGDVVDDPAVASQLASEPEDQYYARVYREYVAAKTAIGENVSNIPEDRFIKRLQGNATALAKKHGCPAVRFQVETRGNQVALKPVLIR